MPEPLPTRITVDNASPDFHGYGWMVKLDGEEVEGVQFADTVAGEVGCLIRNAHGRFYVDPWTQEVALAHRRGVVTFEPDSAKRYHMRRS